MTPIRFQNAAFITSVFDSRKITLPRRPEIVFVGRSNVGKSSMINAILNRKALARTSSAPGKTISINFYDIDQKLYLCDVPGYGYAQRAMQQRQTWNRLIGGYLQSERDIRLIVLLIDLRHPPAQSDMEMFQYLIQTGLPFCIAATKADKLSKTAAQENINALCDQFDMNVICFSAQTKQGVEDLKKIIENAVFPSENAISDQTLQKE